MRQWQEMLEKYDALSLRERVIIAIAIVAVILMLWLEFVYSGFNDSQQLKSAELDTLSGQLNATEQQLAALKQALQKDPNAVLREQLETLTKETEQTDTQLQARMHGLIEPEQMTKVLEAVLTQQTDLKLLSIRNLPIRQIALAQQAPADADPQNTGQDAGQGAGTQQTSGVYQHGMELQIQGTYLSTLEYLKALQSLPWKFYWDDLNLTVDSYPTAVITITVHTLSLKEGWIGV